MLHDAGYSVRALWSNSRTAVLRLLSAAWRHRRAERGRERSVHAVETTAARRCCG